MSRTELLKELNQQLTDLIAEIEAEVEEQDLAKSEYDHWSDIHYALTQQTSELDYLIASMDAADERTFYDEDGNEEEDQRDNDGSIFH